LIFSADGSFHFIHAHIATGAISSDNPQKPRIPKFVLGQERLTVNQAIAAIKQKNFSHSLSLPLANLLIVLFRIQMAGMSSLRNPHFTTKPNQPCKPGVANYCATLRRVEN